MANYGIATNFASGERFAVETESDGTLRRAARCSNYAPNLKAGYLKLVIDISKTDTIDEARRLMTCSPVVVALALN